MVHFIPRSKISNASKVVKIYFNDEIVNLYGPTKTIVLTRMSDSLVIFGEKKKHMASCRH